VSGEEQEHAFAGGLQAAKSKAGVRSSGAVLLLPCSPPIRTACTVLRSFLSEVSGFVLAKTHHFFLNWEMLAELLAFSKLR